MKIIHVCESIIGGTGSYLAELIPHQVEKYGAGNIFLLIPAEQMSFLDPDIEKAGPEIVTFSRPRRLWGTFHLATAYWRALRRLKPDLVHAHSSIAGGIVRLFRLASRTRIVFCPHGWSMDMTNAWRVRKIAERLERILAHCLDRIIVISHHEYDRAVSIGIDEKSLTLIQNGISREPPAIEPSPWEDDRIKVLYAGRFDYQKGVDVLLKAVEGLEDRISLRLVGDVAVDSDFSTGPLPACATRVGWLDRDRVVAQMKSCDILVVPSRWEGFGLVAVEAMRLSKPVMAAAVGGLQEILGEGRYGYLFPPEDDRALHDFLAHLDKAELRRVGELGHRRFLAEYTSDKMVKAVDEVYRACMAS